MAVDILHRCFASMCFRASLDSWVEELEADRYGREWYAGCEDGSMDIFIKKMYRMDEWYPKNKPSLTHPSWKMRIEHIEKDIRLTKDNINKELGGGFLGYLNGRTNNSYAVFEEEREL